MLWRFYFVFYPLLEKSLTNPTFLFFNFVFVYIISGKRLDKSYTDHAVYTAHDAFPLFFILQKNKRKGIIDHISILGFSGLGKKRYLVTLFYFYYGTLKRKAKGQYIHGPRAFIHHSFYSFIYVICANYRSRIKRIKMIFGGFRN